MQVSSLTCPGKWLGKLLASATLVGAFALPAQADDANQGWRIGASALFSDYQLDSGELDDSAVGAKVYGQYRFNDYLGVELGFLNTGDLEDTQAVGPADDLTLSVQGFTFDVLGFVPLGSDDLAPFVKVGIYSLDQDLETGDSSSERSVDGLTYGVGADIGVAEHWALRIEGNWIDLDGADFWTVGLGVNYRFGK